MDKTTERIINHEQRAHEGRVDGWGTDGLDLAVNQPPYFQFYWALAKTP